MTILAKEKVFRDPVHNFIHVQDDVILNLIDTPEFQRLRRIKALGVANTVFHGAEHTRFQHSLGVYEIARRLVNTFKANQNNVWNDQDTLTVLVAALLHDIGHGAYSHTFEYLFGTDHESVTQSIILEPTTEINRILTEVRPDFPAEVASIIAKTHPNKLLVSMISSQLDVDRMDYLLRDAYFTGAEYGNFDLERILRNARATKDGMLFDIAGLHSIEDYIVSRYQMYLQVYFHPVSRGLEVILEHLLERAKEIYQTDPDPVFFPRLIQPIFDGDLSLHPYLRLDDMVFTTMFNQWQDHSDPILSHLAKRFLNRKPLKSVQVSWDNIQLIDELKTATTAAGFDLKYYSAENDAYDLPYFANDELKPEIEFIDEKGKIHPLSTLSPLVAAIANKQSIDRRFYLPNRVWKQYRKDHQL